MKKAALYLIAVAVLLLNGCATTPPAELYLLHAPDQIAITIQTPEHLQGVRIAIQPIRIPKYLDRPPIITQSESKTRMVYSEFHRWAEPLADNLQDVLVQNLSNQLPGSVIWNSRAMGEVATDYQIEIQILKLTGALGKKTQLSARWSLLSGREYDLIQTGLFRQTQKPADSTYPSYVEAISQLTLELSSEIAAALQKQY